MKPDARIEHEWTSRTDSKLTYRRQEISAKVLVLYGQPLSE